MTGTSEFDRKSRPDGRRQHDAEPAPLHPVGNCGIVIGSSTFVLFLASTESRSARYSKKIFPARSGPGRRAASLLGKDVSKLGRRHRRHDPQAARCAVGAAADEPVVSGVRPWRLLRAQRPQVRGRRLCRRHRSELLLCRRRRARASCSKTWDAAMARIWHWIACEAAPGAIPGPDEVIPVARLVASGKKGGLDPAAPPPPPATRSRRVGEVAARRLSQRLSRRRSPLLGDDTDDHTSPSPRSLVVMSLTMIELYNRPVREVTRRCLRRSRTPG